MATPVSLNKMAALRVSRQNTVCKYTPLPARSITPTPVSTSQLKKLVRAVYGKASRKLFLVKWEGYPESDNSWMPEGSLLRDGCKESIDEFWLKSGLSPAEEFYPDPEGKPRCWMCGYACKNPEMRFLKAHITRAGHNWHKRRAHLTEKRDVLRDKLEKAQQQLPQVHWGDEVIKNCWQFEYLGSIFQPDGDHMPDVQRRIAMAKTRAGQLRHILSSEEVSLDLRLRLYIAGCCSIMTYGAEAWLLDDEACKALNGANAYMLSHITGNNRHYEASPDTTTFNLLLWIRARRLR